MHTAIAAADHAAVHIEITAFTIHTAEIDMAMFRDIFDHTTVHIEDRRFLDIYAKIRIAADFAAVHIEGRTAASDYYATRRSIADHAAIHIEYAVATDIYTALSTFDRTTVHIECTVVVANHRYTTVSQIGSII